MTRAGGGYLLVETVGALAVLSIGILAVHGSMRQIAITRAQAEDYTHARFLLEQLVAGIEARPFLKEEEQSGAYAAPFERFSWRYSVKDIEIQRPPVQVGVPGQLITRGVILPPIHLARITATVSWTRMGRAFSETVETVVEPERLLSEEGVPAEARFAE